MITKDILGHETEDFLVLISEIQPYRFDLIGSERMQRDIFQTGVITNCLLRFGVRLFPELYSVVNALEISL